jgi:hypothetical protein
MGVFPERFRQGDVFVDYVLEDVMFRYEFSTRRFFRKFYGESREDEVPHDSLLFNDATRFGDETDAETYRAGKPRS